MCQKFKLLLCLQHTGKKIIRGSLWSGPEFIEIEIPEEDIWLITCIIVCSLLCQLNDPECRIIPCNVINIKSMSVGMSPLEIKLCIWNQFILKKKV